MGIKTEALLLAQLEALEIKDRDAQAEITKLREEVSYLRHGIKNGHFKSDEQVEIKPLSVEGWRAHPEEMERIDAYIKNLIKEARAAAEPNATYLIGEHGSERYYPTHLADIMRKNLGKNLGDVLGDDEPHEPSSR